MLVVETCELRIAEKKLNPPVHWKLKKTNMAIGQFDTEL